MKDVPLKGFSDYFFENVAVGYTNQLQITSICNAKCIFCSNEQNPFEIKRCSFRPLEEIEKVVWSISEVNGPIRLNDSLPGRLSEGEAFLHPDFFKILKILRSKFNNVIQITTNGTMLSYDFIKELRNYNPLEITISFPTIDKEHWKESFNLDDEKYYTVVHTFPHLITGGIRATANITPMPSWLGWDELERTFCFLAENTTHITVYAPGYTKSSKIVDKLLYDKMELSLFLERMSKKYSFLYSWHLDPRIALYINYDNITNNILFSYESGCKNFLWLTSTAAKERFEKLLSELSMGFPINNTIVEVKNNSYGGNIECVGLWMIQDIYDTLDEYLNENVLPDQIFIPKGFLDKYGYDLCGNNIIDLFKKYNGRRIGLL
jgi:uncharacterized Fe-S cluster-containing radical SAM superfamily protein